MTLITWNAHRKDSLARWEWLHLWKTHSQASIWMYIYIYIFNDVLWIETKISVNNHRAVHTNQIPNRQEIIAVTSDKRHGRLKSQSTWLFIQQHVQLTTKKTSNIRIIWLVDSLRKVMRIQAFPLHDVIVWCADANRAPCRHGLLHGHSLVAVGLSVGYIPASRLAVIGWSKYRVGWPQSQWILSSCDRWELPPFSQRSLTVSFANCQSLWLCKEIVK